MDPFVALLFWLTVRGLSSGFLFCDRSSTKKGVCKVTPTVPLSPAKFTSMMRARLQDLGISSGDVQRYSGHSLKRGAFQLYRSLGLRDEFIMQKIQMVGNRANATYCAAYNDCSSQDLPRFANAEEYIGHAERIMGERNLLMDNEAYDYFLSHFIGDSSENNTYQNT